MTTEEGRGIEITTETKTEETEITVETETDATEITTIEIETETDETEITIIETDDETEAIVIIPDVPVTATMEEGADIKIMEETEKEETEITVETDETEITTIEIAVTETAEVDTKELVQSTTTELLQMENDTGTNHQKFARITFRPPETDWVYPFGILQFRVRELSLLTIPFRESGPLRNLNINDLKKSFP